MEPIHTLRLTLMPLTMEDIEVVLKTRPFSIEKAKAFIEKRIDEMSKKECMYFTIRMRCTNELIGSFTFWNFSDDRKSCEIGYSLLEDYQNQRYMSEVMPAVIDWGFKNLLVETIFCYTPNTSVASNKVLLKANFKKIKEVNECEIDSLQRLTYNVYQLTNKSFN